MNKDFWDKLGVIGTFLSSTLIVVFTTVVTMRTNQLSHEVEEFKTVMEENKMIGGLVMEISKDTTSTVKYDFALLALERYLRNASDDGNLKSQDKDMLVGFAQSLILDRKILHDDISDKNSNRILIPQAFLEKYDSIKYRVTMNTVAGTDKSSNLPDDSAKNTTSEVVQYAPVSQLTDTTQSNTISLLIKKMVYIQFSNDNDRKEVEGIQQKFISSKWIAPGIQQVSGSYTNMIKYFHDEDEDIANEANVLLGNKYKIIPSISPKYQKLVPKGQIEIWIADN